MGLSRNWVTKTTTTTLDSLGSFCPPIIGRTAEIRSVCLSRGGVFCHGKIDTIEWSVELGRSSKLRGMRTTGPSPTQKRWRRTRTAPLLSCFHAMASPCASCSSSLWPRCPRFDPPPHTHSNSLTLSISASLVSSLFVSGENRIRLAAVRRAPPLTSFHSPSAVG